MTTMNNEDPAGPSQHEPKVTGSPDRIWLVYGELEYNDTHAALCRDGEVTWCEDKQYPSDVEYVRADIAADALEELTAENKRLSVQLTKVNARCDHLGIRLGEVIRERDEMRTDTDLTTGSLAAALGWPGGISEPILDLPTLLRMVAELRIAAVGIRSRDTQPDRIEYLRERHAQAMRDAARYRFVRTADKVAISAEAARDPVAYDAAIDAAIAAEKEQPK